MRSRVVDPSRLDALDRAALVYRAYRLHSRVFAGVSLPCFREQVFDGRPGERTRVLLVEDDGELVAYSAVHVCASELGGRRVPLVRAEAGALPEHRGRLFMWRLWARELLRALVVYGTAPVYTGTFVHPSAYLALARLVDVVPRPGEEMPAELLAQLKQARSLDSRGLLPGLAHVGWITRETEAQRARWHSREDELTRFYLRANPRYSEGVGLVVCVRFDLRTLARGVWRAVKRRAS